MLLMCATCCVLLLYATVVCYLLCATVVKSAMYYLLCAAVVKSAMCYSSREDDQEPPLALFIRYPVLNEYFLIAEYPSS